jgi:hypothetical protein
MVTLKAFSPEELLTIRSIFCIVGALVIARGKVFSVETKTVIACPILVLSSVAFFKAVRIWGLSPVMVVVSVMPIINAVAALMRGQKLTKALMISFFFMVIGIILALEPWRIRIHITGMFWALVCMVTGGIVYELWAMSTKTSVTSKCFWSCLSTVAVTMPYIYLIQTDFSLTKYGDSRPQMFLLVFFGVAGVVYYFCNIIPFDHLPSTAACVLLQGAVPMSILGAHFIAGENMDLLQWGGVSITLLGTCILVMYLEKTKSKCP